MSHTEHCYLAYSRSCFVAATTEVATTLRHVHVSVPSFFPFFVVEVKGLFFSEILFPFTCMGSLSWIISFGILVTAWSLEENFTVRNTSVVDHTLDFKKKSYTPIGSYIGVDYWYSLECSWEGGIIGYMSHLTLVLSNLLFMVATKKSTWYTLQCPWEASIETPLPPTPLPLLEGSSSNPNYSGTGHNLSLGKVDFGFDTIKFTWSKHKAL